MGIKNYKNNLLATFSNIANRKKPKYINTVCIDLNTILHKVCHNSKNNSQFEKILISEIKQIIIKLNPKNLYIFTDGQAVLAKAITQKKRRNKYLYQASSGISTLNLTPGTPFMEFVDNIIIKYLKTLNINTYYSSSRINNEGELKLFSWLKQNNINSNICIVGDDSDLIVLSLINTPLTKLYIYNNKSYVSLNKLIINLSNFVPNKFNFKYHPVRKDFALLSILMGNDYMKCLANFKYLLEAYKKLQESKEGFLISRNNKLNLKAIYKLLSKIKIKDNKVYTKQDVIDYFIALEWNLNLYYGIVDNSYIPKYKNINIKTILKYFPKKINYKFNKTEWLHKDVYLLLLMPSVGIELVPKRLKYLMQDKSPIKDLFPAPCQECIKFKKKLNELNKLLENNNDKELKKENSILNKKYKNHINENHKINLLPIDRIKRHIKIN